MGSESLLAMKAGGDLPPVTGVVLAGGLGRRMGGADKGLELLDGRPMVQQVIARLAPQVSELLINSNRNADVYGAFGYPVVADRIAGFAGPLAGLHAALLHARESLVIAVPCDSPFLPTDLVARLYEGMSAAQADLAVARAGERTHSVFCLCRRDLLAHLESYLDAGGRRVDRWHAMLKVAPVDFDDQHEAFSNINTAEDLARHSRIR